MLTFSSITLLLLFRASKNRQITGNQSSRPFRVLHHSREGIITSLLSRCGLITKLSYFIFIFSSFLSCPIVNQHAFIGPSCWSSSFHFHLSWWYLEIEKGLNSWYLYCQTRWLASAAPPTTNWTNLRRISTFWMKALLQHFKIGLSLIWQKCFG